MKPSPAFQFYPADFLTGTSEMSAEEVGAYIRLLCHQWINGSLPQEVEKIARIAVCSEVAASVVSLKFTRGEDGRLRNARLEDVREKQEEYRRKQTQNGQRGGRPNKPNAKPTENPTLNPEQTQRLTGGVSQTKAKSNPNETSLSLYPPKGGIVGERDGELVLDGAPPLKAKDEIENIYRLYPKKVGRGSAIKAITSALRHATAEQIIAGLERAKRTWIAKGTEEQYIPNPATWFNGQRWMDEDFATPVSVVSDDDREARREEQARIDQQYREESERDEAKMLARIRWRQADPETRGMIPFASEEEIVLYGGVIES